MAPERGFPEAEYQARLDKAQALMAKHGLDRVSTNLENLQSFLENKYVIHSERLSICRLKYSNPSNCNLAMPLELRVYIQMSPEYLTAVCSHRTSHRGSFVFVRQSLSP